MKETHSTSVEVGRDDHHVELNPVNPDTSLMIITWVAFFIVLAILRKFAWEPILNALEKRENVIRQSLDDADKLKADLERIEQKHDEIVASADEKAKQIVEDSRVAAKEAAKHIQEKAREESQILLENAKREIKDELENARAVIKEEGVRVAVKLAEKLVEKNLDEKTNNRLIEKFIKEN